MKLCNRWKTGTQTFLIIFAYLLIISLAIIVISPDKNTEIEPKVECTATKQQDNNIITISNTFNLSNAEYTERIFKDIIITSYNNDPAQTDDSPNVTATNRGVREGIVAVSYDFINKGLIRYGDLLYIDCFGKWYLVEDTMNKRFIKRVDIFLFDKKESSKINKKCNIKVIHINK